MKGIVFTEFLEMVDSRFGEKVCDHIIDISDLPSNGSYTAVGTYGCNEIITLVEALSEEMNIDVPTLTKTFGEYLFQTFTKKYNTFFDAKTNKGCLNFLMQINDVIHPEVRKLYPDAELPHFAHQWEDENTLVMIYTSNRPFAKLAEGLIIGAIRHFNENITLTVNDLSQGQNTSCRFTLTKQHD